MMKIRQNKNINAAVEAMENSFDFQDDAYVGPFWYDPNKKEVYGYVLALASEKPFYNSKEWNTAVKTSNALHKTIWRKESIRGKDKRFSGDYTKYPKGRVFEFQNEGFKICVGSWIDKYPEAVQMIIDVFNLPKDNTEILKDSHWDIGHGWSDEF